MSRTAAPSRHPLRALRHRNFRLFFTGQLISLIGTWMQTVAQSWLVYRLSHSAFLLGSVGFASQVPVFLLAAFGGHLADRYDRRKILVVTQSCAMLLAGTLATLTLTELIETWHIFVLASLLGIVNAVDMPTRQAFLSQMVEREDLVNAIALNSSMFNGARIVGPAVAGILVAAIGEGWCFLLNSVSYIAVIAGLLRMQLPAFFRSDETGSMWTKVAAGFRFAATTAPVRALLLLIALLSFTGMPYQVLMPLFADQVLGAGARGLGILMGAAGVGALLGSVTLAMKASLSGLGRWVAAACGTFGAALVAFGLSRNFLASVGILTIAGFAMMVQMASSNTLIQSMVPDALRGRVMSLYAMMNVGVGPFGALVAGSAAESIGATTTVAIGGAFTMLGALIFYLRLPALRQPARELIIAQQAAAGEPVEQTTATGAQ